MNALIKGIRTFLGFSQQELADRIGVTFATINRWENSKATPTRLAQTRIYEFCKGMDVPVCDMLLQRIREETENITSLEDRVVLYHGSKSGIEGPLAPVSRARCDFGTGFYMGTNPMQTLTLTCDYEKSKFYIVSVSLSGLRTLDISEDLSWAMIVAFNRGKMDSIKGSGLFESYRKTCADKDLIVGSIADDRMFYVLDNFFQGNITDLALIKSLSALQMGRQYVAVSQRGCDAVRIEKEISISYLEKRFIQDVSEENRVKGVSLANEICKKYRRRGKFFDEILDQ